MTDHLLTLSDGRTLSYATYGDPTGRPLLALHGTPGSRLTWASAHDAAVRAGIRLISPERPGLGASSSKRDVTFASYADDLRELLTALGLERVTLAGASGGGGFALAAAASLPDHISRLVLACAMVPDVPRSALAGQSRTIRSAIAVARLTPRLATRVLASQVSKTKEPSPKSREKALRALPDADRRVIESGVAEQTTIADGREALRQGGAAAVHELRLYSRPLGLSYKDIRVPVVVLHGTQDANVPLGVARWLLTQIPSAELVELPDAGHLFLFERPDLLLDHVV